MARRGKSKGLGENRRDKCRGGSLSPSRRWLVRQEAVSYLCAITGQRPLEGYEYCCSPSGLLLTESRLTRDDAEVLLDELLDAADADRDLVYRRLADRWRRLRKVMKRRTGWYSRVAMMRPDEAWEKPEEVG